MSGNDPFIPTYQTCDKVTPQCPVEATIYGTELSFGAAVFFAIAFFLCFLVQLYFGIRARTWSFMIWLGLGTGFEALGYFQRTKLARNAWDMNPFIIQYLTLLLAPTLVAASISILCKHIVLWYGAQWSVLRPKLYPWVFVGTDFISIGIQVVGGGAVAASASGQGGKTIAKLGEALVIGGVAFQIFNMLVCTILMAVYYIRRRKSSPKGVQPPVAAAPAGAIALSRDTASEAEAAKVRKFVIAMSIAYIVIIVRCCYRFTENIPSISMQVMRNEPLFLALDGGMILIAVTATTVLHPYKFFRFLGVKPNSESYWRINQVEMQPQPYSGGQQHP
ncbi:RTA1 like protein-domain-containing protein [Plectosphaerella plurivora]|uniref:RTA1 like protein-domain-containing protein n=1 Tax=Plectosphaerella plurivora TaxID=936078 RepID=A0A9P8VBE6_9PEZI|nr:RTA1 like protein-domain-containing protein [Plectosphaerella plurivora]